MTMTLRCGRICYTNDLPIYAAFDAGAIPYPGTLHADVPARLNAMLLAGELDVSPISAFAWARHAGELVLLPDLCIGARDEVVSVVLVSQRPLEQLDGARIAVTRESASGANLLRVLLERRFGVHPAYEESADPLADAANGCPALLIGDRAIDALLSLPRENVYDLGSLWHEWTRQQTVFAVWAARRDVYDREPQGVRDCMHALTDAYTWSRSHMEFVLAQAQRAYPRPTGFYEEYYGKLNFTFHFAAQCGLEAFCRELLAIGAIEHMPPVFPEAIGVPA
ncbi:MAG TPA: menaquinone biosynthesis protein [Candidatus Dormibacteraeota bacterium]|nr:menaquinone biosynthesis protein [Candidatus Dormibacteraeota bacterium]